MTDRQRSDGIDSCTCESVVDDSVILEASDLIITSIPGGPRAENAGHTKALMSSIPSNFYCYSGE